MRIRNVLVPMDFSQPSLLALNHGIAFARQYQARLSLLHVVESSSVLNIAFPAETARIEIEHSAHAQRMLNALADAESDTGLDIQTLVQTGDVEDQILATIREEDIDFVVIGTHSRSLVGRSLIGSVAENVLRKVEIPVMTVCRASPVPAFDRMMLATDLSESSQEGSDIALELARETGSNLVVFHAVEVGIEGGAEAAVYLGKPRLEEAREKLQDLKAAAPQQDVQVQAVLAETTVAHTILRAAAKNFADLIVILFQKNGMVETKLGTTAERVIRDAHVPVLSIPIGTHAKGEKLREVA
jgi:nucleotide-binding universal stress UspA family protein